ARMRLYGLLGVRRGASDAAVRSAYRRRALATHPDKGGSASEFLEVVEAFEVLSDPARRAAYERELVRADDPDGIAAADAGGASQASEDDAPLAPAPAPPRAAPAAPAPEGQGAAEERRVAALWRELSALPAEQRRARVERLTARSAEALLRHAEARDCFCAAPVVAGDSPAAVGSTAPAPPPAEACCAPSPTGPRQWGPSADADSCGADLLAGGAAAGEGAAPKRRRLRGPAMRGGSRAWVCLDNLKICSGAARDVAEAIDWHVLLVRLKQTFHALREGCDFDEALRQAVGLVLGECAAAGGTDPRLRYVYEHTAPGGEVLFTPATWDLEVALRRHAELQRLLGLGATHGEMRAAVRRMAAASEAAEEEQQRLADLLRGHLRAFQRLLRWHGRRPEGVNAVLAGRGRAWVSPVGWWAWCPVARARHARADEALRDLVLVSGALASGGEDAARAEARRLYEVPALRSKWSIIRSERWHLAFVMVPECSASLWVGYSGDLFDAVIDSASELH
ncbi:unnamed protein product, partial [Prorocentrum cordatum]